MTHSDGMTSATAWIARLLVLLAVLVVGGPLVAAPPMVLGGASSSFPLGGAYLECLEDKTGELTITEVTSPRHASSFEPSRQQVPSFGLSDSAFWFRFTIDPGLRAGDRWVLLLDQPLMHEVDLYLPNPDGTFAVQCSGAGRPDALRALPGRDALLPLPSMTSSQTFYLRARIAGRAYFPLVVMTEGAYHQHADRMDRLMSGYAGFMAAMLLLGLVLLSILGDRDYLLYAFYLLSMLLAILTANGYLHSGLAHLSPRLQGHAGSWIWILPLLMGSVFARSFLQTAVHAPRHDRVLAWGNGLIAALAVLLPVFPPLVGRHLVNTLQFPLVLAAVSAAAVGLRQGYFPALYFLGGRFLIITGGLAFALSNLGLAPPIFLTVTFLMVGSVMDIVFLAFGMGHKVWTVRRRNFQLLADLQAEVAAKGQANLALAEQISHRQQLEREIVRISDDERRRISHELHDGLCQQLTGARLRFAALEERFSSSGMQEDVRPLGRLLDESVDHAYRLSRGLWTQGGDGQGVPLDLAELTRKLSEEHGIPIFLDQQPSCLSCPGENLSQVVLIAREATLNALKHARASRISVRLACDPDRGITLEVEDDGVGLDGLTESHGNMGISIMKHRAELIGGTLRIETGDLGGTRVTCTAPCQEGGR